MSADAPKTVWHARTPLPRRAPLPGPRTCEVAVVGGGFAGLAAACALAEGGADVVLLEAERIAHGASGRNAGFVVPNFSKADPAQVIARLGPDRGRALLRLVGGAADRVFAIAREAGLGSSAAQTGWLQPAHSPQAASIVAARVRAWADLGRPVTWLDAEETAARTGMPIYHGALHDASGGVVDPVALARALALRAERAGAALFETTPARRIAREGARWRIETPAGPVDARRVLMCTNAGEGGAARLLGRTIIPLQVYQIATEPLDPALVARVSPRREPVSDTRANIFTYRLTDDDRLISGGMAVVPIGAQARMARRIADRLARELDLPRTPRVDFAWRGEAAVTTDFLPHLVALGPDFTGVTACNGRGVAMSVVTGEMLGAAILEGRPLGDLPVPLVPPTPVPARPIARWAPSAFLLRGDRADRRAIARSRASRTTTAKTESQRELT